MDRHLRERPQLFAFGLIATIVLALTLLSGCVNTGATYGNASKADYLLEVRSAITRGNWKSAYIWATDAIKHGSQSERQSTMELARTHPQLIEAGKRRAISLSQDPHALKDLTMDGTRLRDSLDAYQVLAGETRYLELLGIVKGNINKTAPTLHQKTLNEKEEWSIRNWQAKKSSFTLFERQLGMEFGTTFSSMTCPNRSTTRYDFYCFENRKVGTTEIKAFYRFIGEKLASIAFKFDSKDYELITDALKHKFGRAPAKESKVVTNKMGADFINHYASWTTDAGMLRVDRYDGKIGNGVGLIIARDVLTVLDKIKRKEVMDTASGF